MINSESASTYDNKFGTQTEIFCPIHDFCGKDNIAKSSPYKCKVLCHSSGIVKCFEFGCCIIIISTARFHF